ncbi:SNF7 family protein [Nadsonia fulvescens var. elongata DSM 6958]|uniref:SNF7 family protein n=1 Tax=Nadsonia fulvescens var. elongata DSM 6958 TaxID=857566 RepID=A0A1E3PF96_9ASCO|nr:SNF7 family protein [Nadsonia fulvescens var. elongata DSM 6958]
MGNTSSSQKVTAQDKAILDMKVQRDTLKQYQKKITIVLDREAAIARECVAKGDKTRALLALRKRKYQAGLLTTTATQLASLEELVNQVEFAKIRKGVLLGLEKGSQILKELNAEMSLERVENILDKSQEAQRYQAEVSEMLSGAVTSEEEAEVMDELAQLEREVREAEDDLLPTLPEVPSTELKQPEQEEEEEGEREEMEREPQQQAILA